MKVRFVENLELATCNYAFLNLTPPRLEVEEPKNSAKLCP